LLFLPSHWYSRENGNTDVAIPTVYLESPEGACPEFIEVTRRKRIRKMTGKETMKEKGISENYKRRQ
jgi:hypothetical protein|tara:strand:+ start:690 stop:890 length:201 start_codon:yes stop_codon:yes gene_type:complete